jgi:hypothetical protein
MINVVNWLNVVNVVNWGAIAWDWVDHETNLPYLSTIHIAHIQHIDLIVQIVHIHH